TVIRLSARRARPIPAVPRRPHIARFRSLPMSVETTPTPASVPAARKGNHWFTAAAVFAGVLVGVHFADDARPGAALAQPVKSGDPVVPPPFNSAGDRKLLIDQLTELNTKMARIEAKLNSGISVKVTEMPAQPKEK